MRPLRRGGIVGLLSLFFNNGLSKADETPPKPVLRLELPFVDGKAKVFHGWVGFNPTGDRLVGYYTVGEKPHLAVWEPTTGKLLAKHAVENGIKGHNFGPPVGFLPG